MCTIADACLIFQVIVLCMVVDIDTTLRLKLVMFERCHPVLLIPLYVVY